MKRYIRCALLLVLTYLSVTSYAVEHIGGSNIKWEHEPSDNVIIIDDTPHTDLYSWATNNEYDLVFDFEISKYVGDINKLISNGLMKPTVEVYLAVFDVDIKRNTDGSIAKLLHDCDSDGISEEIYYEYNQVFVNGKLVHILESGDERWGVEDNRIKVNVSDLNFPSSPGQSASNTIAVKIDVANRDVETSSGQTGCQMWAMEVDFVSVKFDVVDPFVLVPGFGGSSASFDNSGYANELFTTYGIPAEVISYSNQPTTLSSPYLCAQIESSFNGSEIEIRDKLIAAAENWKTSSLNIITHSKGW